jgi:hypothetical protein
MDRAAGPFGARLGVEGFNQINQKLRRHHLIFSREKFLSFGLLFAVLCS